MSNLMLRRETMQVNFSQGAGINISRKPSLTQYGEYRLSPVMILSNTALNCTVLTGNSQSNYAWIRATDAISVIITSNTITVKYQNNIVSGAFMGFPVKVWASSLNTPDSPADVGKVVYSVTFYPNASN